MTVPSLDGPPPEPVIPACQGWARLDTIEQAVYVAEDMKESEGGAWTVERCSDHFHVKEVLR
jgi:hypothetical protein